MQPKTLKIIFWVLFALFCFANFFSGLVEVFPTLIEQTPEQKAMLDALGYPLYFYTILGVAKILGVIAIIQTKFKLLREWAYAGFTIDYISAALSFLFIGMPMYAIGPIVFLGWLFGVYFLQKKVSY